MTMVMMRTKPDRHTDRAMRGAGAGTLTKAQKRSLCMLARRAYGLQERLGLTDELDFTAWRRIEQYRACGKAHLTDCTNKDFLPIRAHMRRLAGDDDGSTTDRVKHGTQNRQWAMARLRAECTKAADVLQDAFGYASGFVKNKRGCELVEAGARDIWHAIYVVRRRAAQLRRAGAGMFDGEANNEAD